MRLVSIAFYVETCGQVLTKMFVLDELPFRIFEEESFKKFTLVVQHKWVGFPFLLRL